MIETSRILTYFVFSPGLGWGSVLTPLRDAGPGGRHRTLARVHVRFLLRVCVCVLCCGDVWWSRAGVGLIAWCVFVACGEVQAG